MRYHVKDAFDVAYGTDYQWDLCDVEIPLSLPDELRAATVVNVLYDRDLIDREVNVDVLDNGFEVRNAADDTVMYVLVAKPTWA